MVAVEAAGLWCHLHSLTLAKSLRFVLVAVNVDGELKILLVILSVPGSIEGQGR